MGAQTRAKALSPRLLQATLWRSGWWLSQPLRGMHDMTRTVFLKEDIPHRTFSPDAFTSGNWEPLSKSLTPGNSLLQSRVPIFQVGTSRSQTVK